MSIFDNRKRSVTKAITWRCVGTLDTIVISYLFTGSLKIATGIGSFEVVTKMLLYYLHERAWSKVGWGVKKELPDAKVCE